MGRHARTDIAPSESSQLTLTPPFHPRAELNPRSTAEIAPARLETAQVETAQLETVQREAAPYVGRRARASSAALSVADLRERMALDALRLGDPAAAPIVAGALAAARAHQSAVTAASAPSAAAASAARR